MTSGSAPTAFLSLRRRGRAATARSASAAVVLGALAALVLGPLVPRLAATFGARSLVFFLLAVVAAALGFLRPSFAIVATVAGFVFVALLRRLFPTEDPTSDVAAIVPLLVATPLAVRGALARKPLAVALFVGWATVSAASLLLFPLIGLAGWLNLAVPLLAAFGLTRLPDGVAAFARVFVVLGAVAATYGIVQYFVPIPWDLAWLEESTLVSAGTFGTSTFRPFATYPANTTAAMACAVMILILVSKRELLPAWPIVRPWALASALVLLLLTQVRSVWLGLAAALAVAAFTRGGRSVRRVITPVVLVGVVVLVSPQGDLIIGRARTLTDLEADVSFRDRLELLRESASLTSPGGTGLGTLSAGSRARTDASIDNGYLVVLGELGLIGAGLLAWVVAELLRRSRPPDHPFITLLLVTNAAAFVLGNLPGLLLWTLSGLAGDGGAGGDETSANLSPHRR